MDLVVHVSGLTRCCLNNIAIGLRLRVKVVNIMDEDSNTGRGEGNNEAERAACEASDDGRDTSIAETRRCCQTLALSGERAVLNLKTGSLVDTGQYDEGSMDSLAGPEYSMESPILGDIRGCSAKMVHTLNEVIGVSASDGQQASISENEQAGTSEDQQASVETEKGGEENAEDSDKEEWLKLQPPLKRKRLFEREISFSDANTKFRELMEMVDRDEDVSQCMAHLRSLETQQDPEAIFASAISKAIRSGKEKSTQSLLGSGKKLSHIHNVPLLVFAVDSNQPKIAELILSDGYDPNVRRIDGSTPLHSAAWKGQRALVEQLLAYGADIDAKDNNGYTALTSACRKGNIECVKVLLGAKCNLEETDTMHHLTALQWAAKLKEWDIMRCLMEAGAESDVVDRTGRTPVMLALLHSAGIASYMLKVKCQEVNKQDKSGKSLLHYAVIADDISVAKYLLDQGAHVYSRDNEGRTALHYCVNYGKENWVTMVSFLLSKGASIDEPDSYENTPLHLVAVEPYDGSEIVKKLLELGADANAQNSRGFTPLMLAVGTNQCKVVELLASKCDVNILCNQNRSAFDMSMVVPLPCEVCTQTLLDEGAEVHRALRAHDDSGKTLLMLHAENGAIKAVKLLVSLGADVNATMTSGMNALWWVSFWGDFDVGIIKCLIKGNINMDAKVSGDSGISENETVLNLAWRRKQLQVVEILVLAGCDTTSLSRLCEEYQAECHQEQTQAWFSEDNQRRITQLREIGKLPRTLKQLSRTAVRRNLGSVCVQQTVQQLPLPQSMKDYVDLKEIDDLE